MRGAPNADIDRCFLYVGVGPLGDIEPLAPGFDTMEAIYIVRR